MLKHKGSERVAGGIYLSLARRRMEVVQGATGVLPGDAGVTYVRVPLLLMIPLALALSIGYVVFLPFVGFAVVAEWLYSRARQAARPYLRRRPHVVASGASTLRRG